MSDTSPAHIRFRSPTTEAPVARYLAVVLFSAIFGFMMDIYSASIDGVQINAIFRRVNEQGVPATQAELIAEVQDWFAQNSPNGEIPEESTTRKKVAPIWRALRERE